MAEWRPRGSQQMGCSTSDPPSGNVRDTSAAPRTADVSLEVLNSRVGPEADSHSRRNSFSLWRGSNDELSSERDLRFYGIRDEALCLDAFHDFAGTFEFGFVFEAYARSNHNFCDAVLAFDIFERAFGFTFISHRSQTLRLCEREEGQHHSCIDCAHE